MQERVHATTQLAVRYTCPPLPASFPTDTHWLSSSHQSSLAPSLAHMHGAAFALRQVSSASEGNRKLRSPLSVNSDQQVPQTTRGLKVTQYPQPRPVT